MGQFYKMLILFISLISLQNSNSQSYHGLGVDNYGGIHGLILNPSAVVSSKLRADINLFSVSALAANDYFAIDLKSIKAGEAEFNFDSGVRKTPTDSNNFLFNADFIGPSVMFNLSPKHSMAITTRGRGALNFSNLNGELYESFEDGFDETKDIKTEMENLNGTFHTWAEIGLSYGRLILNKEKNLMKGGISLKYLMGAGAMYFSSNQLTADYAGSSGSLATTGDLQYGSTRDFDSQEIELSHAGSGFGIDLGFTYEYRPLSEDNNSDYKLKLALALTDVGKVSYNDVPVNTYDLNASVDTDDFGDADFETILMENYQGTEEITNESIALPTAFNMVLDYMVKKRLYLSLFGNLALTPESKFQTNSLLNSVTVMPRFETQWLGIGIPVGIRQYDQLTVGTNLRLGPFIAGSGSVISNLLANDTRSTDIYVGLKVPLYKK